jgi:hypothetical protein
MTTVHQLAFAAACSVCLGSMANAATIVTDLSFLKTEVAQARAASSGVVGGAGVVAFEGFEDFKAVPSSTSGNTIATAVGVFSGLGGTGGGGAAIAPKNEIKVRNSADLFGRQNITFGGANFLDSNDSLGFSLSVDAAALSLAPFSGISFYLMDVADQKATLSIVENDTTTTLKTLSGQKTGRINYIEILFDKPVDSVALNFSNSKINDGFAIDDIALYGAPTPVPLPPAAALLLGALGVLGAVRRRRASV